MKDIKLKDVFVRNLIHILITLIPIYLIFVVLICLFHSWIYISMGIVLIVLSTVNQFSPIVANWKIMFDLHSKDKKTSTATYEIKEISPDWTTSAFKPKKKYVQDIFTNDPWSIIKICPNGTDVAPVRLYIKRSELEKTGFYNYYAFDYSTSGYPKEYINPVTRNTVLIDVEYYEHSRIVKNIKFYNKEIPTTTNEQEKS